MIDLHLHFDGSLPVGTVIKLAEKQGIELPANNKEELAPYLQAPADCRDLNDYLSRFDLPLKVLQTREALTEAMEDVVEELYEEGLLYAEIRFAPQFHTKKGLTQRQVVDAVLEGMAQGLKKHEPPSLETRLILCCMRGADNEEANLETITIGSEMIGRSRVAAVDLAGAEGIYFTGDYARLFELAKEKKVPYTIHAGEADGPESVKAAIRMGTRRIGHGVRAIEDAKTVEEVREKGITLECCLTSNIQTRAFLSPEDHPLLPLLRSGVKVTVNTDNKTVSNTTIDREFRILKECGMTEEEKQEMLLNSVGAAFLSSEEKEKLARRMKAAF